MDAHGSEDEYLDDPIKLIDYEQQRFGSPTVPGYNREVVPDGVRSYLSKHKSLIETFFDGKFLSECKPVSVLIVDVAKYPQYYKLKTIDNTGTVFKPCNRVEVRNEINLVKELGADCDNDDTAVEGMNCVNINDTNEHINSENIVASSESGKIGVCLNESNIVEESSNNSGIDIKNESLMESKTQNKSASRDIHPLSSNTTERCDISGHDPVHLKQGLNNSTRKAELSNSSDTCAMECSLMSNEVKTLSASGENEETSCFVIKDDIDHTTYTYKENDVANRKEVPVHDAKRVSDLAHKDNRKANMTRRSSKRNCNKTKSRQMKRKRSIRESKPSKRNNESIGLGTNAPGLLYQNANENSNLPVIKDVFSLNCNIYNGMLRTEYDNENNGFSQNYLNLVNQYNSNNRKGNWSRNFITDATTGCKSRCDIQNVTNVFNVLEQNRDENRTSRVKDEKTDSGQNSTQNILTRADEMRTGNYEEDEANLFTCRENVEAKKVQNYQNINKNADTIKNNNVTFSEVNETLPKYVSTKPRLPFTYSFGTISMVKHEIPHRPPRISPDSGMLQQSTTKLQQNLPTSQPKSKCDGAIKTEKVLIPCLYVKYLNDAPNEPLNMNNSSCNCAKNDNNMNSESLTKSSRRNSAKKCHRARGYSPPVLPIPTYEKIFEYLANVSLCDAHLRISNMFQQADVSSNGASLRKRRSDAAFVGVNGEKMMKKITLDEYKRRLIDGEATCPQ